MLFSVAVLPNEIVFFCATISINVQIMTLRFHLVEVLSFLVQEVSQVTNILPLANGEEEITGDTF